MSQFYDQASLVMVPSGYKAGKVYSQKPLSTDGELTFTRNSNATRVVLSASGQPLVEKVRTNLLTYSEQFDNAAWVKTSTGTALAPVVTANAGIAPDGTTTADRVVFNATAGGSVLLQNVSGAVGYTLSIYVKSNTGSNQSIQLRIDSAPNAIITATTEWQRFSVKANSWSASTRDVGLDLRTAVATSADLLVWGAQWEASDVVTDYIATTTAAVSVGPTANVPRLDYSGGCSRLILEPQRTNLLYSSEALTSTDWTKYGGQTITGNDAISPDGYQNADKMVDAGGVFQQRAFSPSTAYALSVFIKKDTATSFRLGFVDYQSGGYFGGDIRYTFATGAITVTQSLNSSVSGEAVDYGNGWIRLICKFTTNASQNYNYQFAEYDGGTGWSWGAQLEAGSYATSYIPTLGASVTRLADVVGTKTVNTLLNQTNNNTLFGEIVNKKQQAGNARFAALYNSAYNNSNRILIYSSHTGSTYEFSLQYKVSDVASVISASGLSYGQPVKWACVFNGTTISLFLNGEKAGSATVTNSDNFYYMNLTDAGDMGFEYKQLLLVPSALSDTDCENLTAL